MPRRPGKYVGVQFTPEQKRARSLWDTANNLRNRLQVVYDHKTGGRSLEDAASWVWARYRRHQRDGRERRAAEFVERARRLSRLTSGKLTKARFIAAVKHEHEHMNRLRRRALRLFPNVEESFTVEYITLPVMGTLRVVGGLSETSNR
jgi:hypothetical protein